MDCCSSGPVFLFGGILLSAGVQNENSIQNVTGGILLQVPGEKMKCNQGSPVCVKDA